MSDDELRNVAGQPESAGGSSPEQRKAANAELKRRGKDTVTPMSWAEWRRQQRKGVGGHPAAKARRRRKGMAESEQPGLLGR